MVHWRRQVTRIITAQSAIVDAVGDIHDMLEAVVSGALATIDGADGAVIEMREGDNMVYRAASGSAAGFVGLELPMRGSLSGECVLSGEPAICHDTETDPRVDRLACRRIGVGSMILVALPGAAGNVGVLKIYSALPRAFQEDDLLIARLLIAPIAFGLANSAQMETSRRFEATFEQAAVGMAHVDITGKFLRANDRFCQIVARGRDDLYRESFQVITHPDDIDADLEQLIDLAAGLIDHYQMEKRYIRPDGSLVWVNLTVSMVALANGSPDFFVAVIEDISRRKRAEGQALRDPLTGLPNRRAMLQRLSSSLADLPTAADGIAVAYFDLDRFKQLNDRLGHAAGDLCLSAVSRLVQDTIRQSDAIYRIAGDEFLLVLAAVTDDDARRTLERLRALIDAESKRQDWRIGVSFGLVVLPGGTTISLEDLLDSADRRMYDAKRLAA